MARQFYLSPHTGFGLPCSNNLVGKSFHFFKLRAALQQQQVNAGLFKTAYLIDYLLWSSDEAGAQTAIRHGIIFERDALFQLSAG